MDLSEYVIPIDDPLFETPAPARKNAEYSSQWITGEFLKGPIPLSWLTSASGLPGKSLQVGLAIWFEYGRRKKRTFKLSSKILERFRVGRKAGYHGLAALEEAGLISVVRENGKNPEITLLLRKDRPP